MPTRKTLLTVAVLLCHFSLAQNLGPAPADGDPSKKDGPAATCTAEPATIQPGQSAKITSQAVGGDLIYAFGSSAGTLAIKGNVATLGTAGVPAGVITVACTALSLSGEVARGNVVVTIAAPPAVSPVTVAAQPTKASNFGGSVAPSLSWITGTQTQTTLGGNATIGLLHAKRYCDPRGLGGDTTAARIITARPTSS